MIEQEEFLDIRDIKYGSELNDGDINNINSHPVGDNERFQNKTRCNFADLLDNKDDLLNYVPEKDRYYLDNSTLVKKDQKLLRKGFSIQDAIVKRMVDQNGKWPTVGGLKRYIALTPFNFFYTPKGSNKNVVFEMNPGEIFFAPRSGENKAKKKAMTKTD